MIHLVLYNKHSPKLLSILYAQCLVEMPVLTFATSSHHLLTVKPLILYNHSTILLHPTELPLRTVTDVRISLCSSVSFCFEFR